MPYKLVKVSKGYKVQSETSGRFLSRHPLTKEMATKQMRAVYAKEKKGHFMEGAGKITVVHYGKTHEIMDGSGFFSDIFGKIKAAAKAGYEAVKRKVDNPRYDFPPKVRAYLQKNAGGVINSIQIRRAPIFTSIEKFLNLLSLGQLQKAKEKYSYDELYHLSMIIGFVVNGTQKYMIAERNEVINIGDDFSADEKTEYITVPIYKDITVGELFDKAIKLEGRNFFIYDAFTNNCQKFIKSILDANGLSTNESNNFILQDVAGIKSELPSYVAPVAKGITDAAAAVNRIIEGEGKPRIDFDKIKWGTFTKTFERFQKKHKDIKDINEFADYVIAHKDDFQKTTVRRARFYKNILKKHKIDGGALFTNPRVAWQAQNIRNENIRAPEVQKKYQERYEGVLKPLMDVAAKVGATGVLGPAGTAAAQAYNYATKLGQVLPVVGAVVGSGSKKLPSANVINKWFENKAIDAYGRQLAIDTWLETNWLDLLSMLQKEYKLSDEDVVNTIQAWFKSQVEKGKLTQMEWLQKWLDEPELLEGGGPGSSGVRKFNRGMKGKMLPLAVNVADAIISNRGNPVGMFSALVDTATNAAATAAQGGSVMKTALGGMKAYAKMCGGRVPDTDEISNYLQMGARDAGEFEGAEEDDEDYDYNIATSDWFENNYDDVIAGMREEFNASDAEILRGLRYWYDDGSGGMDYYFGWLEDRLNDSQGSQGAMTHYSISDDSEISEEDMDALLAQQEYQMERQRALSQNYNQDLTDDEEDTFFGTEAAQEDDAARQQIAARRRAEEELIGEPGSRRTTPSSSQNPSQNENPEGMGKRRKMRGSALRRNIRRIETRLERIERNRRERAEAARRRQILRQQQIMREELEEDDDYQAQLQEQQEARERAEEEAQYPQLAERRQRQRQRQQERQQQAIELFFNIRRQSRDAGMTGRELGNIVANSVAGDEDVYNDVLQMFSNNGISFDSDRTIMEQERAFAFPEEQGRGKMRGKGPAQSRPQPQPLPQRRFQNVNDLLDTNNLARQAADVFTLRDEQGFGDALSSPVPIENARQLANYYRRNTRVATEAIMRLYPELEGHLPGLQRRYRMLVAEILQRAERPADYESGEESEEDTFFGSEEAQEDDAARQQIAARRRAQEEEIGEPGSPTRARSRVSSAENPEGLGKKRRGRPRKMTGGMERQRAQRPNLRQRLGLPALTINTNLPPVGDLLGLNPFARVAPELRRRREDLIPGRDIITPPRRVVRQREAQQGIQDNIRGATTPERRGGSKYKSKDEVLADLRETGMVREFGPALFNKSRQQLMDMLKEIYKQHPEKAPKKMVIPKKAQAAPAEKKPRGRPRKAVALPKKEETVAVAKRGRGRPRKVVGGADNTTTPPRRAQPAQAPPPPVRERTRRTRPRRNVEPVIAESNIVLESPDRGSIIETPPRRVRKTTLDLEGGKRRQRKSATASVSKKNKRSSK